jgi:hypothetical protein
VGGARYTHLCWVCATEKGLAHNLDPSTLLSTDYQLDKFIKHTVPSSNETLQSVFNDPTYQNYERWAVNAVASGCAVLDAHGHTAYVFLATREVGLTLKNGSFHTVGDAVKVVLAEDPFKVHAYPISSHVIVPVRCVRCGGPVIPR